MTEYRHVHIPSDLVFTVNFAERNRPMRSDSDRGRFGYDFVNLPERIREPLLRKYSELEPVSKEQALGHRSGPARAASVRDAEQADAVLLLGEE
jgi:predicted molibdopterin-dependent oxidoreductase YjgC